MHLDTSADLSKMTTHIRRFVNLTGWKRWERRLASLQQQVKDNPFLEGLFDERYRLEWEMGRQYQLFLLGKKVRLPDYDHEIALFSFIVMVSCVSQRLSAEGRNRLSGMLRSGLDAKHGIASVEFEFIIATHLMQHGFDVEFSDIEGESRFDMLVDGV